MDTCLILLREGWDLRGGRGKGLCVTVEEKKLKEWIRFRCNETFGMNSLR